MTTAVTTPNQLDERLRAIAAGSGVDLSMTTRRTTDDTKLYAGITCYNEDDAQQLLQAIRAAAATFGPEGERLTARREHRHLSVFLPVPRPDAQRGAQFLSAISRPTTEF